RRASASATVVLPEPGEPETISTWPANWSMSGFSEYVAQPRRGAAGLERLLLAFMRRPAGEPDDFQRGADAAIGVAVPLGISLHGRGQQRRGGQPARPVGKGIGGAQSLDFAHQGQGI